MRDDGTQKAATHASGADKALVTSPADASQKGNRQRGTTGSDSEDDLPLSKTKAATQAATKAALGGHRG